LFETLSNQRLIRLIGEANDAQLVAAVGLLFEKSVLLEVSQRIE
jgi:hypothetical protein